MTTYSWEGTGQIDTSYDAGASNSNLSTASAAQLGFNSNNSSGGLNTPATSNSGGKATKNKNASYYAHETFGKGKWKNGTYQKAKKPAQKPATAQKAQATKAILPLKKVSRVALETAMHSKFTGLSQANSGKSDFDLFEGDVKKGERDLGIAKNILVSDFKRNWSAKNLQTIKYIPGVAGVGAVADAGSGLVEVAGSDVLKIAGTGIAGAIGLIGYKEATKKKQITQARTLPVSTTRNRQARPAKRASLYGKDYLNINKKENQYKKQNKYDFINQKKNLNRNPNKDNFYNPVSDDVFNENGLKDLNTLKKKNLNRNENRNQNQNANREETENRDETRTETRNTNVNKFITENVDISRNGEKKKKRKLVFPFPLNRQQAKKQRPAKRQAYKPKTVKEFIRPFGNFMGTTKRPVKQTSKKAKGKKAWWERLI